MKRRAIRRIVVFLLLGAIVNVAVAWIPCWEFASDLPFQKNSRLSGPEADALWKLHAPGNWPSEYVFAERHRYLNWTFDVARDKAGPASAAHVVARTRQGWPMRTVESVRRFWPHVREPSSRFEEIVPLRSGRGARYLVLPYKPLTIGFAINTVFYATVLAVLFLGSGMVRRAVRHRRGLCPACGYPVGQSPVCTECGAAVSPRRGSGM